MDMVASLTINALMILIPAAVVGAVWVCRKELSGAMRLILRLK